MDLKKILPVLFFNVLEIVLNLTLLIARVGFVFDWERIKRMAVGDTYHDINASVGGNRMLNRYGYVGAA